MPEHTYKPSIGWWLKDRRGLCVGRTHECAIKKVRWIILTPAYRS
jgi:hypothetical protein